MCVFQYTGQDFCPSPSCTLPLYPFPLCHFLLYPSLLSYFLLYPPLLCSCHSQLPFLRYDHGHHCHGHAYARGQFCGGQKKRPSPGPAPGLPSALCLPAIIIRFYPYSVHDACPFHVKSSCVLQSAYTRAASNYHHFCIKVASSGNFQEQFIDSFIKTNCYYGFFLLSPAENIFFKVRSCFH